MGLRVALITFSLIAWFATVAAPVQACTITSEGGTCTFSCGSSVVPGQELTMIVVMSSGDAGEVVAASAICEAAAASCADIEHCTGGTFNEVQSSGTCKLISGTSASCATCPALVEVEGCP